MIKFSAAPKAAVTLLCHSGGFRCFSPFIVLQYGTLFFFIFIIKAAQKKVNHNSSLVKSLEKNQETAGLNPFAFFGTQRGSGIYFLAYSE